MTILTVSRATGKKDLESEILKYIVPLSIAPSSTCLNYLKLKENNSIKIISRNSNTILLLTQFRANFTSTKIFILVLVTKSLNAKTAQVV